MKLIAKQVNGKPLTVTVEYPELNAETERLIKKIKSFDTVIPGSQNGEIFALQISDIYYIEAVERKVFLYTKDSVYMTDKKLYELENQLSETGILRISKSCLMNIDMLCSIKQLINSQLEATLVNGEKLIVARTYLKSIKNILRREKPC
ncbi:MAG: LytTR family transcriptional regulator DNA-binding domain-containing protein [Lachnospiraceae bacterium]|nr:LytTR family transcriptional regulator DNA-binding domain-containing protein [Lachnospiraceae bacterium]MDE7331120.1 LytTR family transcriptional regulator DNA-binding domain-containing protein [Lachnospiraceae bacterium]